MHLTSRQAIYTWLFLVLASLITAWLAEDGVLVGVWPVFAVLAIALLKARAVILYYMEIRAAPWQLRFAFEVWAWGVTGLIAGFWLLQSANV